MKSYQENYSDFSRYLPRINIKGIPPKIFSQKSMNILSKLRHFCKDSLLLLLILHFKTGLVVLRDCSLKKQSYYGITILLTCLSTWVTSAFQIPLCPSKSSTEKSIAWWDLQLYIFLTSNEVTSCSTSRIFCSFFYSAAFSNTCMIKIVLLSPISANHLLEGGKGRSKKREINKAISLIYISY